MLILLSSLEFYLSLERMRLFYVKGRVMMMVLWWRCYCLRRHCEDQTK